MIVPFVNLRNYRTRFSIRVAVGVSRVFEKTVKETKTASHKASLSTPTITIGIKKARNALGVFSFRLLNS